MFKLSKLEWVCLIVLLIGSINYGFVGILGLDIIRMILGRMFGTLAAIAILVAAVYMIYAIWNWRKEKKEEESSSE